MPTMNMLKVIGWACFLGLGITYSGYSQTNMVLNFNTDFTWKAQSATVNGGFVSNGGSNAWMFNTFNASSWPNAVAGSWGIPAVNDIPGVQHIWNNPYNDSVLLRQEFVVPVADSYTGTILSQVDNQYSLFFNGVLLGAGSYNPTPPANYNIAPSLQGCVNNVVAMEARNWGGPYGAKMAINITAINVLLPPVANPATNITCNSFTANWDSVATADEYLLDISTDPLFSTYYTIYNSFNVGNVLSVNVTGVPGPGPYYYRLRAQRTNAAGLRISCYSNVITVNLGFNPVNAGSDVSICPGAGIQLNGVGTGVPTWSPPIGLTQTNILNPVASPSVTTDYILSLDDAGCIGTDTVRVNVISVPTLNITPDTAVCTGGCIDISAIGADYVVWSPFAGMVDSSLTTQSVCPMTTTDYIVNAYNVGPNLIVNGNFSGGNVGFSSSYTYAFPNTTEGEYYVGTNPQAWNGGLSPCGDHTSGTGNMMMVNGSQVANTSIWCQTVNVSPNTDYLFSTWITPAYAVNYPNLQFSINGNAIGSIFTPSGPNCNWEEFFTMWNSGVSTTANICIVNQNTNFSGNDFGLDDISFSPLCTHTDTITVAVYNIPVPNVTNTGPYCEGDTILLNSGSGFITDDWTGPNGFVANNNPTPFIASSTLPANGTYTVTVTTPGGCSGTGTTDVIVNPLPIINVTNNGPLCAGDTLMLTSGGGIQYAWMGPAGFSDPVNQNITLFNATTVQSGNYTVNVTDANGCSATATTNVIVNALPTVLANINTPVCEGQLMDLNAMGATNYDWMGPNAFNVTGNANPQISNASALNAGLYTVTGTDANGCSATATVNAVVNPTPLPAFTADQTSGCAPLCVQFTDNSTVTGSIITGWNWNIEGMSSNNSANPTVCFNNAGLYDITLTVTTAEGCSASLVQPDMIDVTPAPFAEFNYAPQQISELDPQVNFSNLSIAATNYLWNFGDGSSANATSPQHTYADTGTYCVVLVASNALGCTDTVEHCLQIKPFYTIYIPNTFTPNDDGINPIFMAYGTGVKSLRATIFNRWGQEIYSFDSIEKGWNGNMHNGQPCPQGTYVYRMDVVDGFNKEHQYIGMVNLIR